MKVGVIGTGKMGENHIRAYLSLSNHCELVGIYDTDETKRNQIANRYQIRPFYSIDNLLQSVEAVSIVVPTEYHYDVGLACIEKNVHMLVEKPITSTVTQAEELNQKANEANVKLQVGHIELFNPLIQLLKKELDNEKVIEIVHNRMSPYDNRMKNIDVVNDLMIHDLYILNELLEHDLSEFHVIGKVVNGVPKHAIAITNVGGVTAHLTASFIAQQKVRTIKILTENAFIVTDILNNNIKIQRFMKENSSNISIPVSETIHVDGSIQPLSLQLLNFINNVKNDKTPSVSGEEGMKILSISNNISESISNQ